MQKLNLQEMESAQGGLFKGCGVFKRASKRARKAGYITSAIRLLGQHRVCKEYS